MPGPTHRLSLPAGGAAYPLRLRVPGFVIVSDAPPPYVQYGSVRFSADASPDTPVRWSWSEVSKAVSNA